MQSLNRTLRLRPVVKPARPRRVNAVGRDAGRARLPWRWTMGSGGGGKGGNGNGDFSGGDDDDFGPRNFHLFAALSLLAEENTTKIPVLIIAQSKADEAEAVEEETDEYYIRPAPKPKAESLSFDPKAPLLLLLLLLSGGFFFWRRRSRNSQQGADDDEQVLVQRQRDINLEPGATGEEVTVQGSDFVPREPERMPDYMKELSQHDALFDVDRGVQLERHESGVEDKVTVEPQELPPASAEGSPDPDAPSPLHPENSAKEEDFPYTTEEQSNEIYYEDMEKKEEIFKDDRVEQLKDPGLSQNLVNIQFIIHSQPTEAISLELFYSKNKQEHQQQPPLDKVDVVMSERSLTMQSPTSQMDGGSNQSTATHFSGDRTPEAARSESPPPIIPEKEEAAVETDEDEDPEELDFDTYLPIKNAVVDENEDLGPPIKPTAIDFTKPSDWEEKRPLMDERTNTMQYLLSNADLLTEALKQMEYPSTKPVTKPLPETSTEGKSKSSKKKKRRQTKKKKASA